MNKNSQMTNNETDWRDYPIGIEVVGYRFGKAPISGYSYNYAEGKNEAGVSMASVGLIPESRGFATMEAKESRRKYYYRGIIVGTGGDDEVCLTDCVQITAKEYNAGKGNEAGQDVYAIWLSRKMCTIERKLVGYYGILTRRAYPMLDKEDVTIKYNNELETIARIYGADMANIVKAKYDEAYKTRLANCRE